MTRIEGLDELQQKLSRLQDFQAWARGPMTQSTSLIVDDLAKHKPKAQGAFSAMATDRQRKAYWAQVSSGRISHISSGYKRTGETGRGWTDEVTPTGDGVRGVVGNNAPGARWVHGATTQQRFHAATGFLRTDEALRKNTDKIETLWKAAVRRELTR